MATDTQIVYSQVAAGHSDYPVPSAVELKLKAVSALFTDNGAGTAWLPAVVLISDSGHVIVRALDQSVKVDAGGSAEVSWFPGGGLMGGSGIRFDTDNEGGWLQVNTNLGGATAVFDDQTISNAGAVLQTSDGSILALGTRLSADTYVDSSGNLFLSGGAGGLTQGFLTLDTSGDIVGQAGLIDLEGSTQVLLSSVGSIVLEVNPGGSTTAVQVKLANGHIFAVTDFTNPTPTFWFFVGSTGVFMPHLPTVNPGVAGQLWRSGNQVMIV